MKKVIMIISFLFVASLSYSQSLALQSYASDLRSQLVAEGYTILYENYCDIKSGYGHTTGEFQFHGNIAYGAVIVIEDCYSTPYFTFRDTHGNDYHQESEAGTEGNFKYAIAGIGSTVWHMGQIIGWLDTSDYYTTYMVLYQAGN